VFYSVLNILIVVPSLASSIVAIRYESNQH